ncbi:NAD(P)-binding protein [Schizophyllum commune H4-8]|uniref:NmrA-like domain-containing protein n=1 Tax=Schizophyllum commune (strain H4-8 / FGSC 9210) TaxID=578458 RepID=D8QFK1_SCHCM|nr:NAD(P)-binding protein [Schizophyllum commune H4-8]KAI5887676.1 NAD(P)-binding protein [Schizophyllum commune H4-8]
MSSPRRIATIFGATGQQGGSVIDALLADDIFTPRAVTRDASSAAAKALEARGCEVVEANAADKEAVRRAVQGAECHRPLTPVPELQQGTNMVDASKEAGVKFFVWSSLPSIKEISGGKYTQVQHFEDKAAVEKYLKASDVANASIMTGFFLENFLTTMPLRPITTGYHVDTPSSLTATNTVCCIGKEMGSAVAALMRNYKDKLDDINGQNYILGHGRATLEEIVAEISKALEKPVTIKQVEKMGFPALDEMFDFNAEYDRYAGKPCPDPRLLSLGAEVGTVNEFTEKVLKPFLEKKGAQ